MPDARNKEALLRQNLKDAGCEKEILLDHNVYTFNKRSRQKWTKRGVLWQTNPLELNARELREISYEYSIQVVYGRYPMMVTAGCVHKTLNQCKKKPEQWFLRDRYRKEFPVKNYCLDCYNEEGRPGGNGTSRAAMMFLSNWLNGFG